MTDHTAEMHPCVVPGCDNRPMLCRVVCREHNPRPWSDDDGSWREPHMVIPPEGDRR